MEHYEQIMERVKIVVEERLHVTVENIFSVDGVTVSIYCEQYCYNFVGTVHYRELEMDDPVLYIANKLVGDVESELISNIER